MGKHHTDISSFTSWQRGNSYPYFAGKETESVRELAPKLLSLSPTFFAIIIIKIILLHPLLFPRYRGQPLSWQTLPNIWVLCKLACKSPQPWELGTGICRIPTHPRGYWQNWVKEPSQSGGAEDFLQVRRLHTIVKGKTHEEKLGKMKKKFNIIWACLKICKIYNVVSWALERNYCNLKGRIFCWIGLLWLIYYWLMPLWGSSEEKDTKCELD